MGELEDENVFFPCLEVHQELNFISGGGKLPEELEPKRLKIL